MAHTKIASQTSFKGLFLQKVGTKLHVLRFCMSKPNFLQKKHIMIDFLFFFQYVSAVIFPKHAIT